MHLFIGIGRRFIVCEYMSNTRRIGCASACSGARSVLTGTGNESGVALRPPMIELAPTTTRRYCPSCGIWMAALCVRQVLMPAV
ncbi:hypothetical protein FKP32DRAFT_824216 [Trametes sanguinea]|nr:hypothetical protein FKP32DRAFT_824216 [Trametes sanguinea]